MSNARSKVSTEKRRIVINDASCLIDLRKVDLIEAMLRLPYEFAVALPVASNELLDFSQDDWKKLSDAGLQQVDLSGAQVGRAMALRTAHPKLSAEDCFSFVLTQDSNKGILLTGDAALRAAVEAQGHECHGVLWVADELHAKKVVQPPKLIESLTIWNDDPLVRVPAQLIVARLKTLGHVEVDTGVETA